MSNSDMRIGCHVSISGSVDLAFSRARKLGCNTFQVFTKSPRSWSARVFKEEEINLFRSISATKEIYPVFAHISYLPNLASQDDEIYKKSIESFKLEIERCIQLDIPYFVIHGGSYKGGTFEKGLDKYVNSVLKGIEFGLGKVKILIENSSGGGSSLTGTLTNIEKIISEVGDDTAVQVCFDTCHAFGSGYNLRNEKAVNHTLQEIEGTIGSTNIVVIHANDSKGELGSFRDRHEHLGLGEIGDEGFKAMINNKIFQKKPWILETPINEIRGDVENLKYLYSLRNK